VQALDRCGCWLGVAHHRGLTSQAAETLPSSTVLRHGTTSKPARSVAEGVPKDVEKYVRPLASVESVTNFFGGLLKIEIRRFDWPAGWEHGRTTRAALSCVTANVLRRRLDRSFIASKHDFLSTIPYHRLLCPASYRFSREGRKRSERESAQLCPAR